MVSKKNRKLRQQVFLFKYEWEVFQNKIFRVILNIEIIDPA